MGVLPGKRITLQCRLLGIEGSGLLPGELSSVAAVDDGAHLHLTLLHLGKLGELASDIRVASNRNGELVEIELELRRWVLEVPRLEAFDAKSGNVSLFGAPDNPVAALEVLPSPEIGAMRDNMYRSMCDLLNGFGIANVESFVSHSKTLGFTGAKWRPHVTLGRPLVAHGEFPIEMSPMLLHFEASEVRNGESLRSDE